MDRPLQGASPRADSAGERLRIGKAVIAADFDERLGWEAALGHEFESAKGITSSDRLCRYEWSSWL